MLHGRPFVIPMKISKEYVIYAEELVNVSYSHSETFSSVSYYTNYIKVIAIEDIDFFPTLQLYEEP